MNHYQVILSETVEIQLADAKARISLIATPSTVDGYIAGILAFCDDFTMFPHRGINRDDIRPGLRVVSYRKRVDIAIVVDDDARTVSILHVFFGGQDYETLLHGL